MYSDLYIKHRFQNKNLIAVVSAVILFVLVFFVVIQDSSPTRASKLNILEHQIVNISPHEFGVLWQLDEADSGWLIYGKTRSKMNEIIFDERDKASSKSKRKYHFASITNLEPNTTYFYKIISNNEVVESASEDVYSVTTLPSDTVPSRRSPVYGKVVFPNNDPAANIFSRLMIGNTYSHITLTSKTGEWLIPPQYIVREGTNTLYSIEDNIPVTLQFFDDDYSSTVRTTFDRSRPLPQQIMLGNNYIFVDEGTNVLSAQDTVQSRPTTPRFNVELRYPKENSVIPGQTPLIKGIGVPGSVVSVSINTTPVFSGRSTVDADGDWSVVVKKPFNPGTYTISMQTTDRNGQIVTITRSFTLIKSGEQVLGESTTATPSASIVPSVTVVIQTPAPTGAISSAPIQTATPAPPVSGVDVSPFLLAGFGLITIAAGVLLLL